MKHRATGRPRGRPATVPFDLDNRIYELLKRKMDPATHMVAPQWKELARELGVSRSTISRNIPYLKAAGLVESVIECSSADARMKRVLYKVNNYSNMGTFGA